MEKTEKIRRWVSLVRLIYSAKEGFRIAKGPDLQKEIQIAEKEVREIERSLNLSHEQIGFLAKSLVSKAENAEIAEN